MPLNLEEIENMSEGEFEAAMEASLKALDGSGGDDCPHRWEIFHSNGSPALRLGNRDEHPMRPWCVAKCRGTKRILIARTSDWHQYGEIPSLPYDDSECGRVEVDGRWVASMPRALPWKSTSLNDVKLHDCGVSVRHNERRQISRQVK